MASLEAGARFTLLISRDGTEPAIDHIPREHFDLARRVLSIQCDQRYASSAMIRVAEIVKPILRDWPVLHGS